MLVAVVGSCPLSVKPVVKYLLELGLKVALITEIEKDLPLTENLEVINPKRGFNAILGTFKVLKPEIVINLTGFLCEEDQNEYLQKLEEYTQKLVEIAKETSINRIVHFSSCRVGDYFGDDFYKLHFRLEKLITQSGLKYTVFKPSLVITNHSFLMEEIRQLAKTSPVVVVPKVRTQPIHMDNILLAIEKAVKDDVLENKVCELGGPQIMSLKRVMEELFAAAGVERNVIELPRYLFPLTLPVLKKLSIMTFDQIERVKIHSFCFENCTPSITALVKDPFEF
jgi:NADH dehydrogenase